MTDETASRTVMVVEDEQHLRELYETLLRPIGCTVLPFATIAAAEKVLATTQPDAMVLDVRLPDGDGLALLQRLRASGSRVPVILATALGTVERAVEALRLGAFDFVVKPFDNARLVSAVEAALKTTTELTEVELQSAKGMVGTDGGLKDIAEELPNIASSDATVLIRGESGTGKELIARAVHAASLRRDGPFISVNCAALTPSLLESELFGFERGSFTGAHQRRVGFVEQAHGGTLFLDEIGDMPLEAQARLLRVLQEREIIRVGGREVVKVDIRVVAATHQPLEQLVAEKKFRHDLLYRLAVVPIEVPPLRSRRHDIPGLIEYFLEKHSTRHKRTIPRPSNEIIARAVAWSWPGNVRELENVVERAVVLGRFDVSMIPTDATVTTSVAMTASAPLPQGAPVRTLRDAVAMAEREAVVAALAHAQGNKAEAARMLGVSYKTLFNKLHEHHIEA